MQNDWEAALTWTTERPLDGHVAVVTGAARGLGFAAAERLAADGAAAVLVDLDVDGVGMAAARLQDVGHVVTPLAADLTSEAEVAQVFADVRRRHGRIDVLVNMAGIYPAVPFDELTYEQWRTVITANLDSTFLCARAAFADMRRNGYGRIVNVSSGTVLTGMAGQTAYVASKAGVIGFTRALANEAGAHGITVNAVMPGLIATEHVLATIEELFDSEIVPQQAVPRRGEPADIAEAVAYLAAPAAGFITGQTINVDGGMRFL